MVKLREYMRSASLLLALASGLYNGSADIGKTKTEVKIAPAPESLEKAVILEIPSPVLIETGAWRIRGTNHIDGIAMTYFKPAKNRGLKTYKLVNVFEQLPNGNQDIIPDDAIALMYVSREQYEGNTLSIVVRDNRKNIVLVEGKVDLRNPKLRPIGDDNLMYIGHLDIPSFKEDVKKKKLPIRLDGDGIYSLGCYLNEEKKPRHVKMFFIKYGQDNVK